MKVLHAEHLPQTGGCILVANHVSFLDPLLICAMMPRVVHYITYAFFYYLPWLHWYCKRVYCIPVKKDGKDISAFKAALRVLKQGEVVGIFPEGVRSATGELGEGEPGVALLALKAGVPIVPIGIHGTYEAFPRGAKFPKPVVVTLKLGEPFRLEEYFDVRSPKTVETQQAAVELIMTKIAELCTPQKLPI